MNPTNGEYEPGESGYGTWIRFWAELLVLGVVAVLGASFASADAEPGDYACGLALIAAAAALAFLRIKGRFDGAVVDWGGFALVDDMPSLGAVIVILAVLALGGLFVAGEVAEGGLHDAGVALFVTSALAVFLSLKHVFDVIDRRH